MGPKGTAGCTKMPSQIKQLTKVAPTERIKYHKREESKLKEPITHKMCHWIKGKREGGPAQTTSVQLRPPANGNTVENYCYLSLAI